jgi:SAM-dependent methyltransferase
LKQFLDSGAIRPCRAAVLGCGTGDNAVFLARQGFDVTGIDIAPTALQIAGKKSQQAEVRVKWLLADVLRPPQLEPFEFIFDRGCYHDVRRQEPEAYVAALRGLASPGARILILAGNANPDNFWRFDGPPRVKEEEIRRDFAEGFHLRSLRPFRFDTADAKHAGALAWAVLLERKSRP